MSLKKTHTHIRKRNISRYIVYISTEAHTSEVGRRLSLSANRKFNGLMMGTPSTECERERPISIYHIPYPISHRSPPQVGLKLSMATNKHIKMKKEKQS